MCACFLETCDHIGPRRGFLTRYIFCTTLALASLQTVELLGALLSMAARTRRRDTLEAVVTNLKDKLKPTEVKVESATSLVSPCVLQSSSMAHHFWSMRLKYSSDCTTNSMSRCSCSWAKNEDACAHEGTPQGNVSRCYSAAV